LGIYYGDRIKTVYATIKPAEYRKQWPKKDKWFYNDNKLSFGMNLDNFFEEWLKQ
jgi:hypothetical protein